MKPRALSQVCPRIVGVVLALLVCIGSAEASSRVALVIGNSAYRNVSKLVNPANDAADISTALERLGFSVTRVDDATYDMMRRALLEFGRLARNAEYAVVFYAGHGMEVGGENWLLPIDAELRSDVDVDHEAFGLKSVMLTVENASRLGLVILDACRNNPFSAKMKRTVRTRAVTRGLAHVEPNQNVLVAYSAKDGTLAADGDGRNSPFTGALLRHLETPGLEVNFLFRNVRDDVIRATNREQQPFVYGSLSRDAIYLASAGPADMPGSSATQSSVEIAYWDSIKQSTNIGAFQSYLKAYPNGAFSALARLRIEELRKASPQDAAKAKRSEPAAKGSKCFSFQGKQFCE